MQLWTNNYKLAIKIKCILGNVHLSNSNLGKKKVNLTRFTHLKVCYNKISIEQSCDYMASLFSLFPMRIPVAIFKISSFERVF